jgi:predicted  nucleic acid-binding Zn-ribbon protein
MPHQCVHCGNVFPDAAEEVLKGCTCGSHFFYYIKEMPSSEVKEAIVELEKSDKEQIEKDIREITGQEEKSDEPKKPVILDLESVKVIKPGQFEIDIVNLFNKRRPLIYKLEEGKYIIDLAASLKNVSQEEIDKKITDPDLVKNKEE